MEDIRICLMGEFSVYIDGRKVGPLINRSRKGLALIQYLILQRGEPVHNYRLIEALWQDNLSAHPDNALKTLVSRMRSLMNELSDQFGRSIVAERGAYRWDGRDGVTVDVYEVEELLGELANMHDLDALTQQKCQRLIDIYSGDLMQGAENCDWALARAVALHNQYLSCLNTLIALLAAESRYEEIAAVCRKGLEIDAFDDQLNLGLINALSKMGRNSEAASQYKRITNLHFRHLGEQPPPMIQAFYEQLMQAGRTLEMSLDTIRLELREHDKVACAFVCEYSVFKEIFNLQMRNLERLGSTMFLALIMVSSLDDAPFAPLEQADIMQGLIDVLKSGLRKGDTVTQFSPTLVALLLPMVSFTSGNQIMERTKRQFYQRFAESHVMFRYRVGPLNAEIDERGRLCL
ncbi:MAG: BTAD domain-containing putative transcriptional regulator [Clostridia bacterium]